MRRNRHSVGFPAKAPLSLASLSGLQEESGRAGDFAHFGIIFTFRVRISSSKAPAPRRDCSPGLGAAESQAPWGAQPSSFTEVWRLEACIQTPSLPPGAFNVSGLSQEPREHRGKNPAQRLPRSVPDTCWVAQWRPQCLVDAGRI